jgi:hypothetical protein
MKRLQPLLLLTLLLATTLGVGPCSDQPLGSADGGATCTYAGRVVAAGATFPSSDGCNTCSCLEGNVACTEKACAPDAAVDGSGAGSCRDNGRVYADGESFPAGDGCNSCSCVNGAVGCTTRGCAVDAGGAGTVACDDGTGATDCCLGTATGMCSNEGLSCWTACNFPSADATDGYRGQKFCGGGQWISGKGLFPCTRNAADGGGAGTVACNDGTGATDCCPGSSTAETCSNEGLRCWTACSFASASTNAGFRGQKFCGGGQWAVGMGLFPCSRAASDGGGVFDGDGARVPCTPGADQTCNDDPRVSSLWGHCEATGVCTCAAGRTINPATGRCRL